MLRRKVLTSAGPPFVLEGLRGHNDDVGPEGWFVQRINTLKEMSAPRVKPEKPSAAAAFSSVLAGGKIGVKFCGRPVHEILDLNDWKSERAGGGNPKRDANKNDKGVKLLTETPLEVSDRIARHCKAAIASSSSGISRRSSSALPAGFYRRISLDGARRQEYVEAATGRVFASAQAAWVNSCEGQRFLADQRNTGLFDEEED